MDIEIIKLATIGLLGKPAKELALFKSDRRHRLRVGCFAGNRGHVMMIVKSYFLVKQKLERR